MKAVIVFVLLFASVFCHPVKRSASSSESSEEVVRPAPALRKAPLRVTMKAAEPTPSADSDESTETSEETEESNTESDDSTDSADSVDTEESETEESVSESTESGEAPTAATTVIPVSIVVPTFPVYTDNGRGDNMGYSDYKKSIMYEQSNVVEKEPSPYKSYIDDKMGLNLVSKKSGATFDDGAANDVEKTLKVYKALQVHEDILEEDASTPDVDSQGLDASSGAPEEAGTPKQAAGATDEVGLDSSASAGPASQSESNSQSEEEAAAEGADGASAGSADSDGTSESESASASQEQEDESDSSQSSEESNATATPGAADSDESEDSDEGDSSSEEQGPKPTSEAPILVITAK